MKLPFELTLYVYKRPNLRSYSVEMEAFMGLNVLRDMYDDMKVNDVDSLYLSFPERWLNILELRQLPDRLVKYCPNLKTVTIKTHSVYLVQCVRSEHIKIIQHDENGRLVDFFDTAALANEVCNLLQDETTRQRLSTNARLSIQNSYDLKTICLPKQIQWVESLFTGH